MVNIMTSTANTLTTYYVVSDDFQYAKEDPDFKTIYMSSDFTHAKQFNSADQALTRIKEQKLGDKYDKLTILKIQVDVVETISIKKTEDEQLKTLIEIKRRELAKLEAKLEKNH